MITTKRDMEDLIYRTYPGVRSIETGDVSEDGKISVTVECPRSMFETIMSEWPDFVKDNIPIGITAELFPKFSIDAPVGNLHRKGTW